MDADELSGVIGYNIDDQIFEQQRHDEQVRRVIDRSVRAGLGMVPYAGQALNDFYDDISAHYTPRHVEDAVLEDTDRLHVEIERQYALNGWEIRDEISQHYLDGLRDARLTGQQQFLYAREGISYLTHQLSGVQSEVDSLRVASDELSDVLILNTETLQQGISEVLGELNALNQNISEVEAAVGNNAELIESTRERLEVLYDRSSALIRENVSLTEENGDRLDTLLKHFVTRQAQALNGGIYEYHREIQTLRSEYDEAQSSNRPPNELAEIQTRLLDRLSTLRNDFNQRDQTIRKVGSTAAAVGKIVECIGSAERGNKITSVANTSISILSSLNQIHGVLSLAPSMLSGASGLMDLTSSLASPVGAIFSGVSLLTGLFGRKKAQPDPLMEIARVLFEQIAAFKDLVESRFNSVELLATLVNHEVVTGFIRVFQTQGDIQKSLYQLYRRTMLNHEEMVTGVRTLNQKTQTLLDSLHALQVFPSASTMVTDIQEVLGLGVIYSPDKYEESRSKISGILSTRSKNFSVTGQAIAETEVSDMLGKANSSYYINFLRLFYNAYRDQLSEEEKARFDQYPEEFANFEIYRLAFPTLINLNEKYPSIGMSRLNLDRVEEYYLEFERLQHFILDIRKSGVINYCINQYMKAIDALMRAFISRYAAEVQRHNELLSAAFSDRSRSLREDHRMVFTNQAVKPLMNNRELLKYARCDVHFLAGRKPNNENQSYSADEILSGSLPQSGFNQKLNQDLTGFLAQRREALVNRMLTDSKQGLTQLLSSHLDSADSYEDGVQIGPFRVSHTRRRYYLFPHSSVTNGDILPLDTRLQGYLLNDNHVNQAEALGLGYLQYFYYFNEDNQFCIRAEFTFRNHGAVVLADYQPGAKKRVSSTDAKGILAEFDVVTKTSPTSTNQAESFGFSYSQGGKASRVAGTSGKITLPSHFQYTKGGFSSKLFTDMPYTLHLNTEALDALASQVSTEVARLEYAIVRSLYAPTAMIVDESTVYDFEQTVNEFDKQYKTLSCFIETAYHDHIVAENSGLARLFNDAETVYQKSDFHVKFETSVSHTLSNCITQLRSAWDFALALKAYLQQLNQTLGDDPDNLLFDVIESDYCGYIEGREYTLSPAANAAKRMINFYLAHKSSDTWALVRDTVLDYGPEATISVLHELELNHDTRGMIEGLRADGGYARLTSLSSTASTQDLSDSVNETEHPATPPRSRLSESPRVVMFGNSAAANQDNPAEPIASESLEAEAPNVANT